LKYTAIGVVKVLGSLTPAQAVHGLAWITESWPLEYSLELFSRTVEASKDVDRDWKEKVREAFMEIVKKRSEENSIKR
jgi:hypothetical protein